jgi:hypothetical protein
LFAIPCSVFVINWRKIQIYTVSKRIRAAKQGPVQKAQSPLLPGGIEAFSVHINLIVRTGSDAGLDS